ncbi:MAG: metalloregulator ArsR/SmtB family transcription factor [Pseudomonadota bacterium]
MLKLDEAAAGLEALGNPSRLTIYRILVRAGYDGKPVGQIQQATGIAASTLSHHLKHLELAKLVTRRKNGTTHFCCANYDAMEALLEFLTEECCAEGDEDQQLSPRWR